MFEKVFNGLYVLHGNDFVENVSGNVFLLIGKRTALIDSGNNAGCNYLMDSLKELGLKASDIDVILHTHGHCDHFGGDSLFKKSEIFMSEFDGNYVNIKDGVFTASSMLGSFFFPKISSFFQENEMVFLGSFELQAIFTPGHTAGSVCFFEKSKKWLFSGDTLFDGTCGRFDLPSGSRKKLIDSLKKLKQLDFELLLPGHGNIVSKNQKQNIDLALKVLG